MLDDNVRRIDFLAVLVVVAVCLDPAGHAHALTLFKVILGKLCGLAKRYAADKIRLVRRHAVDGKRKLSDLRFVLVLGKRDYGIRGQTTDQINIIHNVLSARRRPGAGYNIPGSAPGRRQ